MDKTIEYYNKNAKEYVERTISVDMSPTYKYFLKHLNPGDHICDLGCGSGRDSKYFSSKGFSITSIDGSYEMCKLASNLLARKVLHLNFNEINFKDEFDAIWACSSLLHIQKSELTKIFRKLVLATKNNSIIYTCFKYGESEEITDGRLFSNYTQKELINFISSEKSLDLVELWISDDSSRKYTKWLNVIIRVTKKDI
jgi:cyclopropane fatty-acyl-phospholipid synthase-like methyltransferase